VVAEGIAPTKPLGGAFTVRCICYYTNTTIKIIPETEMFYGKIKRVFRQVCSLPYY
jgi:hypothetical protein